MMAQKLKTPVHLVFGVTPSHTGGEKLFFRHNVAAALNEGLQKNRNASLIYPHQHGYDTSDATPEKARNTIVGVESTDSKVVIKEIRKNLKGDAYYAGVIKKTVENGLFLTDFTSNCGEMRGLDKIFPILLGFEPDAVERNRKAPGTVRFFIEPMVAEAVYHLTKQDMYEKLTPYQSSGGNLIQYAVKCLENGMMGMFLRDKAVVSLAERLASDFPGQYIIIPRSSESVSMTALFDRDVFDISQDIGTRRGGIYCAAAEKFYKNNGTMDEDMLVKYATLYQTSWQMLIRFVQTPARKEYLETFALMSYKHAIREYPALATELDLR